MTGTPAHSPEPAGQWVAARHRELLDGLGQYLDLDAGLRDIMLHADHTDVIGTLGSHLDAQAGLAAILPPSAETAPKSPHQTETAAAIAAVDPAVRITLRRNPVILAAILGDLTVRALTIAENAHAARARDLTRDLTWDLTRDLAIDRALARALDRDLTRVRDFALDPASALDLDRDLNDALNLASDLARAPARALDPASALDLASALARVLARVLDLDRAPSLASVRARALTRDLDRDLHPHSALAPDLAIDRALARALALAHQTALVIGDALGIRQTESLAAALLEGVLDDFTRADLAHADLTGRDLTGIRWSDWGTTWPPGTDTDALRTQSREVSDASGIYVITGPGHDDRARHHTRT